MLDDMLARKIDSPGEGEIDIAGKEVVDMVVHLVELDGLDM